MLLGTGRILRPVQSYCLGRGQPEYEIRWEARGIALDLLVEALGSHAIEGGELGSWVLPKFRHYELERRDRMGATFRSPRSISSRSAVHVSNAALRSAK